MLVLSRRESQSIVIGKDITITVVSIRGDQVRIGIDAPRSVDVYREEIYEQVRQENLTAIANVNEIRQAVQDTPVADPDDRDD